MKRKLEEEHLDYLRHEEELRQREETEKKVEQQRLALALSGKVQGEGKNWLREEAKQKVERERIEAKAEEDL